MDLRRRGPYTRCVSRSTAAATPLGLDPFGESSEDKKTAFITEVGVWVCVGVCMSM